MTKLYLIVISALLLFVACSDDVSDEYAHERAFLKFAPVTGVVPLNNAVNSMGHFCAITMGDKHLSISQQ